MTTSFKITECPVCGNDHFTPFLSVPDWLVSKEEFKLLQCDECTFVFTANAPIAEEIGPYYNSEEYVEHSDTRKGLIYGIYHYARKMMLRYKRNIIGKLDTGRRLLDVGSGSGYFVNHMKQNGYDVTGVEISDKAVQLCEKNFGIRARSPQELLEGKIEGQFDLITLWHVFEHVYTYDEYFKRFGEMLSSNGKLILALPNHTCYDSKFYGKYWAAYDTPRHLWHFSPNTLQQFAEKHGFRVIKKRRLPLDPFFNSMVSASYKPGFTFLPFTLVIAKISYLRSWFKLDRSSSLIYILEKV